MKRLHISLELSLPVEAATETFGILAKKGAGKSNAAVVMAEEMFDAGIPWVAIDPKGDWWGLRSSGDGKKPGLPIVVFGGRHGDIPLEPTAGRMLADLVLSERLTCVLDVSEFSTADVTRFLLAFADRLYRQAEAEPLHLFLEEAHEYLPQMVRGDKAPLVGAWQRIVKMGRTKGLGVTLISQRSAALNKDVLTQVDTLIVLQTNSPQDRAAVKAWIDVNSDHREALDSLPHLKKGEAWVWSPSFLSKPLQRIQFRRRRTFDSGATPKVGEVRKAPSTLADVNLDAIRKQMNDTIEKAKAEDPRELRRQIAELRKQLEAAKPQIIEKVVEVEMPVLDEASVKMIRALDSQLRILMKHIETGLPAKLKKMELVPEIPRPAPKKVVTGSENATPIRGGAMRMLETLGKHREFRVTRSMLGTLSRMKPTSGSFSTYLSALKTQGLISVEDGYVSITDAGLNHLGAVPAVPTTTDEVLEQWHRVIKGGARRMLDILVERHPHSVSRSELAELAELSASSGSFSTYLSMLRSNGLAEVHGSEVRASDALFLGGGFDGTK